MSDLKKSKIEKLRRQIQEKQDKLRRSVERIQNLLAEAEEQSGKPPEGKQYGYDSKEQRVKLFPDPLVYERGRQIILPKEKYYRPVREFIEKYGEPPEGHSYVFNPYKNCVEYDGGEEIPRSLFTKDKNSV